VSVFRHSAVLGVKQEDVAGCAVGRTVICRGLYEGVSRSFRTGRLERELQTVQLSASYFVIQPSEFCCHNRLCYFSMSIVVSIYFVIDSVRKLSDTPSYQSVC
jgi:hypothetical protein